MEEEDKGSGLYFLWIASILNLLELTETRPWGNTALLTCHIGDSVSAETVTEQVLYWCHLCGKEKGKSCHLLTNPGETTGGIHTVLILYGRICNPECSACG